MISAWSSWQTPCTLKNNAVEEAFLSKWFHKEPLTSEEPFCFTKGQKSKSKSALLSILPHVPYIHTEFSGAWCKRGEGGQGREGVQLPDSLVDEAVLQSVGPGLETPQSPPWWQQTEEAVCRVGGITCNVEGFAGETGAVDVLEGGERAALWRKKVLQIIKR